MSIHFPCLTFRFVHSELQKKKRARFEVGTLTMHLLKKRMRDKLSSEPIFNQNGEHKRKTKNSEKQGIIFSTRKPTNGRGK